MGRNNRDFQEGQFNPLEKVAGFQNPHGKWSFKVGDVVNMAATKGKLTALNPKMFASQLEGRLGESKEENRARTDAVDMSHPIIALAHPDGSHSIIDGTHRVQHAFENGMESINARVVTHDDMAPWSQSTE